MKIVTNDYGCGTSSSILDYKIEDVVVVSEKNFDHVYEIQDDLFFVGHDFLFYLWNTKEKIDKLKYHKFRKIVWCFERVDAIIPAWKQKSLYSIELINQFADQIYVCDEDDVKKYGDWLPQWASPLFFNNREKEIISNKILFSGQADKPEYKTRNKLLSEIYKDKIFFENFEFSNFKRVLSWEDYTNNLLSYSSILNPVGTLRAFNTRAFEVLYSGRLLLQQTSGKYKNHETLIKENESVVLFETKDELVSKIKDAKIINSTDFYNKNNIFARFNSIGVEIK